VVSVPNSHFLISIRPQALDTTGSGNHDDFVADDELPPATSGRGDGPSSTPIHALYCPVCCHLLYNAADAQQMVQNVIDLQIRTVGTQLECDECDSAFILRKLPRRSSSSTVNPDEPEHDA
jgi:hypothetical protein